MTKQAYFWSSFLACSLSTSAFALEVGQVVEDLTLRDEGTNTETSLPDFGKKVLTVFYTDADAADMNDPLGDAMKTKQLSLETHRSLGVVNLKESKPPNFIIRAIVKGKIEKYKSVILTDSDLLLAKKWGIADTNNTSVIIVIGKDKKVRYVKHGPVRGKEIDAVINIIETAMQPPAAEPPAAFPVEAPAGLKDPGPPADAQSPAPP